MKKKTLDLFDNIQFLIFGGYFIYKSFSFMKTDILKALGTLMLVWFLILFIKQLRIKRIIEQIDVSIFKKINSDNHYNKEKLDKLLSYKKMDSINNILICLGIIYAAVGYVTAIPITLYKYGLLTIILLTILTFGLKTCFTTKNYLEYFGSAYKDVFSNIISTNLRKINMFRNLLMASFSGALYITIIYILFDINFFNCFFQYFSFTILMFLSISFFSIYNKFKKIVRFVFNINMGQLDMGFP
jgi:hypothetical protein